MLIALGFAELSTVFLYGIYCIGRNKTKVSFIKKYLVLDYFCSQFLYIASTKSAMILLGAHGYADQVITYIDRFNELWI